MWDMNNTVIVLNPKEVCETMADYRPISLCNSIYKIISKALENILKKLLNKLISKEKNGFTPSSDIANNIILASKTIHSIKFGCIKGMAIKLDVSKAYDKVSWDFFIVVLSRFRFSNFWIEIIWACITSPRFSIAVNGSLFGFFEATNGL